MLARTAAAEYGLFILGAVIFFDHAGKKTIGNPLLKLCALMSAALQVYTLWDMPFLGVRSWAGETCFILSSALFLWSVFSTHHQPPLEAFCTKAPPTLFNHGPFRWMRHPFYVSYMLAYGGGVIATLSPILFLQSTVMLILYTIAAGHEERKILRSALGKQYSKYRSKVGILGPRITWGAAGKTSLEVL